MIKAITSASIIAREAIEALYNDKCVVIERREKTNELTKKTRFEEVAIIEDQPCRLSFSSVPSTSGGEVSEIVQSVQLFISPDISIKPGSKIVVTQPNREPVEYSNSGKPAIYASHQEIELKLFERWS